MKNRKSYYAILVSAAIACICVYAAAVYAHCDTMSGPVIPEAKAALEKGDVTPILKWVKPENESEVKKAFELAEQVRGKSQEAKELADKYFLETLIRVHRAGEGAPYTGIKETTPEKITILTDQALSSGSADELIGKIQAHLASGIKEKFDKVLQASKNKDKSVEAGREYVEAYVQYTHYVEGIHTAIVSTDSHHGQNPEESQEQIDSKEHKD